MTEGLSPEQAAALGWRIIWIVRNRAGKLVPLIGSTGYDGQDLPKPDNAVTWALGCPDGVIMLDVDHYGGKTGGDTLRDRENELGPLMYTVKITSRDPAYPSGKYLFRVPPGAILHGSAGDGVDLIQRHHRWTWAPGTIHPKTGTEVRCYFTADNRLIDLPAVDKLPGLPSDWITDLSVSRDGGERAEIDVPDDGVTVCAAASAWFRKKNFTGAEPQGQRAFDAVTYLKNKANEGHYITKIIDEVLAALPETSDRDWDDMWNRASVFQPYDDADLTCCNRGLFGLNVPERTAQIAQNGQAPAAPPAQADQEDAGNAGLPDSQPDARNLPAAFWEALPVLRHIQQAAWSRNRPADAVLGAVLGRMAAIWPPSLRLDTGVAEPASANFYVILAGEPGACKTTSVAVSRRLVPSLVWYLGLPVLPDTSSMFADDVPLGSGEGLAEAYITTVITGTGKGQKTERRKTRDHVFVYADEGGAMAAMLARSGATIGETLRRAWMGETIGQANASADRNRIVPRGSYALGLVTGFQPSTAGPLLNDAAAGTPQRFIWLRAGDPAIPDTLPEWPGPLAITWPDLNPLGSLLQFAEQVRDEIRKRDTASARGMAQMLPYAEHEMLTKAKIAALLAILAGEPEADAGTWELAGTTWKASCAVRDDILAWGQQQAQQAEQHIRRIGEGRQKAMADAMDERAMGQAVRSAARHIHRQQCKDGCKRRCVTRSIKSTVLREVSVEDVLDRIVAAGYAEAEGDVFRPGPIEPP